jgi:hypothetical protein
MTVLTFMTERIYAIRKFMIVQLRLRVYKNNCRFNFFKHINFSNLGYGLYPKKVFVQKKKLRYELSNLIQTITNFLYECVQSTTLEKHIYVGQV